MKFNLGLSIDILRRTPATLEALLLGVDDAWSRANEGPETFSPFDVVGHLIDGEETDWIPRARLILAQGSKVRFEPYDRSRHRGRNVGRILPSLLAELSALRTDNLAELAGWQLTEAQLDLAGEHPVFGRVTLRNLLSAWVVHDLEHIAQIARVMAKQYKDDIGPWGEFLPIVNSHPKPKS